MDDGVANRCLWRDPEVMLALLARSLHAPANIMSIAPAIANLQRGGFDPSSSGREVLEKPNANRASCRITAKTLPDNGRAPHAKA